MALYALRTYTRYVGKMADVVEAFPGKPVLAYTDSMAFAVKLRPPIMTQEVKFSAGRSVGPASVKSA
jgi:hypothetical protein